MAELLPEEQLMSDMVLWWRRRKGLTLTEFAKLLGVSAGRAWALENRTRMLTMPTMVAVSKALGITIEQFMSEGSAGVIAARAAGTLTRSHRTGRRILYQRPRCATCGQLARRTRAMLRDTSAAGEGQP